jgi:hypothetical protein
VGRSVLFLHLFERCMITGSVLEAENGYGFFCSMRVALEVKT